MDSIFFVIQYVKISWKFFFEIKNLKKNWSEFFSLRICPRYGIFDFGPGPVWSFILFAGPGQRWTITNTHEANNCVRSCSYEHEQTWTTTNTHFFSKWLNTNQHEFINYRTGTNTNTRVFSSLVRSSQFWFPRKFSSPNFSKIWGD